MAHELSEDAIFERYGTAMWDAFTGFAEDPAYFAAMSEAANQIEAKRSMWQARSRGDAAAA